MPIHTPGEKFRSSRLMKRKKGKREVVALLSLTAMVDMFTVLVIFLLQNYNSEGLLVNTPKDLILPQAEVIKELKPAVIVTVSSSDILVDETSVATFAQVKGQKDWMIQTLFVQMQDSLKKSKEKHDQGMISKVREAVKPNTPPEDPLAWKNVTIQADKGLDFLTLKKIMYTVIEAGAGKINFAVIKKDLNKH